jgi:hypothetical protein
MSQRFSNSSKERIYTHTTESFCTEINISSSSNKSFDLIYTLEWVTLNKAPQSNKQVITKPEVSLPKLSST